MNDRAAAVEQRWALAALAAIVVITLGWWALALWPLAESAPEWVARTREVCFGNSRNALPPPSGWILLFSQPIGMLAVLLTVWGRPLRAGVRRVLGTASGRLAAASALLVVGTAIGAAGWRVASAGELGPAVGAGLGRIAALSDAAPALDLLDHRGDSVHLRLFRDRPVLVTFAFAHCTAICPALVQTAREARRRFAEARAVLLVVTLDPWRDTPARLASLAAQWRLEADEYVLGGTVEAVEASLNAWKVPRVRNQATGDLIHPSVTYVVGPRGQLAYVTDGTLAGLERALAVVAGGD